VPAHLIGHEGHHHAHRMTCPLTATLCSVHMSVKSHNIRANLRLRVIDSDFFASKKSVGVERPRNTPGARLPGVSSQIRRVAYTQSYFTRKFRSTESLRPCAIRTTEACSVPAQYMTPEEKYIFDLNGYIIVKGVLSPDEVALCNQALDVRAGQFQERKGELRLSGSTALGGDGSTGRADLGGMLEWDAPDREPFRSILCHPRLIPYYNELVGKGYRMDHLPLTITQQAGSEGFMFHGGATDSSGEWSQDLAYTFRNGKMYNALLAASLVLSASAEGDGGFAIIPGSHKSNFPCPKGIKAYETHKEFVVNPALEPGDVLLFTEAATHGTIPWKAKHQRRVVIYRFCPHNMSYGRSYFPSWPPKMLEGASEAQLAVLEHPYHIRLDRPVPKQHASFSEESGNSSHVEVEIPQRRADFKIDHDEKVFGTKYF